MSLMSEIRDFFIKTLDDTSVGIGRLSPKLSNVYHIFLRLDLINLQC